MLRAGWGRVGAAWQTGMQQVGEIASVGFQNPLQRLWGAAASLLILAYTIVLGLLCIGMMLLTRKGWPADVLGKVWCRWIVKTCGIQIEVKGLENVDPKGRYVLISNHLSNFDIWCTIAALPLTIRFVAKKELLRVPVFGWALALSDHIVIDRSKPQEAVEIINRKAKEEVQRGFCVLFYGEGTRSPDGKVHRFKKGGVMFALAAGLPIVPVSISGTRKFLPKGSRVIRPGGKVRIVLDRPIPTQGVPLDERDALNGRVRQIVIRNYVENL